MPVNVGTTEAVGVENIKITVLVAVGSGVSVFRGVGVNVSVDVGGMAIKVCVDAALAVCTMNVLMAPGSSVGTGDGAEKAGTHAMTTARIVNQKKNFTVRFDMTSLTPVFQRISLLLFFHDDRNVWVTDLAVDRPGHYGEAFFIRCGPVQVNVILVAGIHGREFNAGDVCHLRSAKIF